MRESTYYPKLCLIQIATQDLCACIDVINLDNIDCLTTFLGQSSAVKILHSARQDLEVLHCSYDLLPKPLFDTQLASCILGMDDQISYSELVAKELSITLPKSQSRTNWKQRPLTDAQIHYALDDVRYLGSLYMQLQLKLENRQRIHWLQEECAHLLSIENYVAEPAHVWKQVKGAGRLNGQPLFVLQQLAAWREQTAMTKDLPRKWILSDQAMIDLSVAKAANANAIKRVLLEQSPKSIKHTEEIMQLLEQAGAAKFENIENIADRRLSKPQQALVKDMMKMIRRHAEEIGTSATLLANRKSLVNLVLGLNSKVNEGWRQKEIGQQLQQMLN
jgi:ribonuclease D